MVYSGFWRRFVAYIIDAVILTIPGLVLGGAINQYAGIGMHLVLGFLYYPFFESSVMAATPGKALMGMAVSTEEGTQISFKTAVLRYFCRYLSFFTCYIGYIMQVFTSKRQTLHDIISKTVVADRKSEDLNYFLVWKDQFKAVVDKL